MMKRKILCLVAMFIVAMCVFASGCIGSDGEEPTIPNLDDEGGSGLVSSEEQRELKRLISIAENPSKDYTVEKRKIDEYSIKYREYYVDGYLFYYDASGTKMRDGFRLSDVKMTKVSNGVAFKYGTESYVFIIKDKSISTNYYIDIVHHYNGNKFLESPIIVLKPSDYDDMIEKIKGFEKK